MRASFIKYCYHRHHDPLHYALIDNNIWNLRELDRIPGGVEFPGRGEDMMKAAYPFDLGRMIRDVAVDATAGLNAQDNNINERVKAAVDRLLADWSGEHSALIDIIPREEDELRYDFCFGVHYPFFALFRDYLFETLKVFRSWDTKATLVKRNLSKRFTFITFRDFEGKYLISAMFWDDD
ncbi:hypothetical protein E8E14_013086 [Neopestalotiopsis sp. 37M]|nr:hypothetical protein E8E14_013086 [Neopestalotiopsis sp. 37M]